MTRKAHVGIMLPTGALIAAAMVLGVLTYRQNRIWAEPIVFYNNIIDNGVLSPATYNNLGVIYMRQHNYNKAIEEFRHANAIVPNIPDSHYNLAMTLLRLPEGDIIFRRLSTNGRR
jgi:tetratricopeptide (TPR) repeat protein